MSLDQQMIVAIMNSLKVLNVRFRGNDITDDTREKLRPLMDDLNKNCLAFIKILREPGNTTTSEEIKTYRLIVKGIKLSTEPQLVAKVKEMCDFIDTHVQVALTEEELIEEDADLEALVANENEEVEPVNETDTELEETDDENSEEEDEPEEEIVDGESSNGEMNDLLDSEDDSINLLVDTDLEDLDDEQGTSSSDLGDLVEPPNDGGASDSDSDVAD